MFDATRAPEKAYAILLWLVSVVFAGFIVGLGNLVIGDLPALEQPTTTPDFVPAATSARIDGALRDIARQRGTLDDKAAIAKIELEQAHHQAESQTDTFEAWIQTRTATTDAHHDPEVLARTRALEAVKANERAAQGLLDDLARARVPLDQQEAALQAEQSRAEAAAGPARERAAFMAELRVFLLRLAITLPMLLVAVWLVLKKRKSDYWPLARGFALAATFVFFVELVPYLPSYGGYVRYGVGIALTLFAGVTLIRSMRGYLERRRAAEAQAQSERHRHVRTDEAIRKVGAGLCPGCDRPIATMEGTKTNFCAQCGLTLYDSCGHCGTRKLTFFRYCVACGTPAGEKAPMPG